MVLVFEVEFIEITAPAPYAYDKILMIFGMFLCIQQRIAVDRVQLQLMPPVFHKQLYQPRDFARPLVVTEERIVK